MKKVFYFASILLLCLNNFVYGQSKNQTLNPKDEISISSNNLNFDNLALKYARNISKDWWLKVGLINLDINSYGHMPYRGSFKYTNTGFNGGLLLGIEKEKAITDKLSLMMGLNAQIIYNYLNHKTEDPTVIESQRDNKVVTYSPGLGFGLGIFYHISNNFLLGAELNPTVSYFHEKSKRYNTNELYVNKGIDFSLNNHNAFLTLKYRF